MIIYDTTIEKTGENGKSILSISKITEHKDKKDYVDHFLFRLDEIKGMTMEYIHSDRPDNPALLIIFTNCRAFTFPYFPLDDANRLRLDWMACI